MLMLIESHWRKKWACRPFHADPSALQNLYLLPPHWDQRRLLEVLGLRWPASTEALKPRTAYFRQSAEDLALTVVLISSFFRDSAVQHESELFSPSHEWAHTRPPKRFALCPRRINWCLLNRGCGKWGECGERGEGVAVMNWQIWRTTGFRSCANKYCCAEKAASHYGMNRVEWSRRETQMFTHKMWRLPVVMQHIYDLHLPGHHDLHESQTLCFLFLSFS